MATEGSQVAVNVDEGDSQTISTSFDSGITSFLKTGGGTLTIDCANVLTLDLRNLDSFTDDRRSETVITFKDTRKNNYYTVRRFVMSGSSILI